MAQIVPYAVWLVIIVTGLGLLAIALFGLRSLIQGKLDPLTIALTAAPLLIVGVLGLVMGDWSHAAILGSLIALALTSLALLLSGVKGLFV